MSEAETPSNVLNRLAARCREIAADLELLSRLLDANVSAVSANVPPSTAASPQRRVERRPPELDVTATLERFGTMDPGRVRDELAGFPVARLEQLARALRVPFSAGKARKAELIAGIVAELRMESGMSTVRQASERAFE